jgi:hypothetical protein
MTDDRGGLTVSVVVETETAAFAGEDLEDAKRRLGAVFGRLLRQAHTTSPLEVILVVDADGPIARWVEVEHPGVRLVHASGHNQFHQKNCGACAAGGDVVALLDADCLPAADWAYHLSEAIARGADVVAGQTVYADDGLWWRTCTALDFGHVQAGTGGEATGLNANNVAFRRSVFGAGFDERVDRFSSCYHLARRLRRDGARIVYEPRMLARHALADADGFRFVRKHVHRGFDNTLLVRADEQGVLAPRAVADHPFLIPPGMGAARIAYDARRFFRDRRDLRLPLASFALFAVTSVVARAAEVAGGYLALARPGHYRGEHG